MFKKICRSRNQISAGPWLHVTEGLTAKEQEEIHKGGLEMFYMLIVVVSVIVRIYQNTWNSTHNKGDFTACKLCFKCNSAF